MKISTRNIGRHVTRFENAVRDHAFIGTIPAGESEAAAAAYNEVQRNYELAKANLIRFMTESIIEGTDK